MTCIDTNDTDLLRLIARARAGEEIVICSDSVPVARLVPIAPQKRKSRRFGAYRGQATVTGAFFEP